MTANASLSKIYKQVVSEAEKGVSKSEFWNTLGNGDYNPDTLRIDTYTKMLLDSQVFAASRMRALAVLSKGIDIDYTGSSKRLGEQMKQYLRDAFINVNRDNYQNGGMFFVLDELMHNGGNFGYAVSEIVFGDYNEFGDGYVYPRKIKVLPALTLKNCFSISDYGDLESVTQNRDGLNEVIFESDVDLFRLLIYTHNRQFSNWYGQSDLKVIYKNWFIKDYLIKFWNIALERYGAPFLLGKVTNPDHIADMNKALDSARTKTNFSIWKNDDVKIIESASTQREAFLSGIKYHDSQIMIGKLMPLLLLGVEQTGARALGDVHFRAFLWTLKYDQRELSSVIDILIRKLIDLNFPNVDVYPTITFPTIANEDFLVMVDAITKLTSATVVAPDEKWIRNILNIPQNDVIVSSGGLWRSRNLKNKPVEIDSNIRTKKRVYYSKMSIKKLKKILDSTERKVENIYLDYLEKQKSKVMKNPGSFKRSEDFEDALRADEDKSSTSLKLLLLAFGNDIIDMEDDIFESLGISMDTTFSRTALRGYISDLARQSFKDSIKELAFEAKAVVLNGQTAGWTQEQIAAEVSRVYDTYTNSQLQTVVRTITNDINNAARLELYKNNEDFVTGVRFDAVLDDRTTEVCETHDGMEIALNNPDLEAFRPPLHFNCRSQYTPITIMDGPFVETYKIGNIYPDEQFGGTYFADKYGELEEA
jgi:SPP1 gp7 family putative phage head morphogenesis protein